MVTDGRVPRLTKPERRQQLLDAAEDLLVDEGAESVTMEAVAARAGVSKALPYAHFQNADEVLFELYQKEMAALGARFEAAVSDESLPGEERLRLALHGFFDMVTERGPVLLALVRSSIPEQVDGGRRIGHRYLAALLRRTLGLEVGHSKVLGTVTFAALRGAVESYARRDARRAVIEEGIWRFITEGARAWAAGDPPAGSDAPGAAGAGEV